MQHKNLIIRDIINFIKTKKITGYEIQQRTNGEITEVAINKIINGKTKIPQNSTIKTLENFLCKNYGYFRTEDLRVTESGHADNIQSHQVKYSREDEASWVLKESQVKYGKPREANTASCSGCEERERIITSKDKQIESLERLIASKDEMLAMKEEAIKGKEATLAAKDETIRIQFRRISELEENKGSETLKKILGTSERIDQESISLTDIHPKDLSTKAKKGEYQV